MIQCTWIVYEIKETLDILFSHIPFRCELLWSSAVYVFSFFSFFTVFIQCPYYPDFPLSIFALVWSLNKPAFSIGGFWPEINLSSIHLLYSMELAVFTPMIMNSLERRGLLRKVPWVNAPLQLLLCGFFLTFATPMCCALFPQKSPIQVTDLEKPLQVNIIIFYCGRSIVLIINCVTLVFLFNWDLLLFKWQTFSMRFWTRIWLSTELV